MSDKIREGRGSIVNLLMLLHDITNNPERYRDDAELKAALTTQVSLAAYANADRGIKAFSLNTFKKHAQGLGETFQGIDQVRKNAFNALEKRAAKSRKKPDSRRSQNETINKLRKERAAQDVDLMRYVMIVMELKELAQKLAQQDLPDRCGYYKKEMSRIDLMLITRGR